MFVNRDDLVLHGRSYGGSISVVLLGLRRAVSCFFEKGVVGELVDTKVYSKGVQQVNFLLYDFPIVKRLEDHFVVDLLGRRYLQRFSRLV